MKKIESFLEFIVAITLVLNCNSIWARHIIPRENSLLLYGAIFLLTLMSVKKILKNKSIFFKIVISILLIDIINLIFIMFNNSNIVSYIVKFIFLLNCFIIYSTAKVMDGKFNSLLIKVSRFVCFLAIISLILYVFGPFLNILPSNSSIFLSWGDERYVNSYYNFLYITQYFTLGGIRLVRNTGIFTEAPMYAFLLCTTLATNLFLQENKVKKIYTIILVITILTTFSTTGIVCMCIMLMIKFMMHNEETRYKRFIKILILPLIIFLGIGISMFFIKDKIEASKYSMGSYSIRLDDFRVGIKVWKNSKLVGIGFENYDFAKQYISTLKRGTDIGGSSGVMHILAQGGTILLLLNIVPYLLLIKSYLKHKNINYIIISTLMLVLLMITAVQYTFITIYYLAWAISIYLCSNKSTIRRKLL